MVLTFGCQAPIGLPLGSIWERTINGVTTDVLPRNYYVELFLRFGIPGLLLLFVLCFMLWRHRTEIASKLGLTLVVGLLLLTQLSFLVTYSPDIVRVLLVGIFVGTLPLTGRKNTRAYVRREESTETDRLVNAR
jgi:hypothetical protein